MYPQQGGQGQLPSHWNTQPPASSQTTNGQYPPPPAHINTSRPPPPPTDPRPDMAALQPQHNQHQPPYRLPAPHEWSRAPPHPDPYRQPPPPHMNYPHQQPAPRQRTAIACRYCRRRKIRCSGFENSEDGRCTNCVRFSQDCIFTPVSAQTQAFVPAHTVWRGGGQAPPLYGAYGQPLPPASHQPDAYAPQPRQQGYPLPSPTASSSASYHSAPPPPQPQPYYTTQPPRRSSPQSAYSYDASRASSSPHTQGPSTPGSAPYYAPPPTDNSLRPLPPRSDGRTPPPPTSQPGSRPGMRINDLVSGDTGRSTTDSDMLNALNRRPM